MADKPPHNNDPGLEVDNSGLEEYRRREELLQREKAQKAEKEIRHQNKRVEALMAAEKENNLPERPPLTRQIILSAVLFFLLTYFCLLAFFDLIKFLEGVRVLGSEVIQLMGSTMAGFWAYRSLNRILDSRKDNGLLWRATRAVTLGATLIVASYLLLMFFRNIPRGGPGGGRNFLAFLFVSSLAIVGLAMVRKKILAAMEDYRSTLLETKLFLVEGIMLNLGLMVIFQYISGVNVGAALLGALAAPKFLLFQFCPLALYFFFRKMLAGFFYH